jgi:hypothetical protein
MAIARHSALSQARHSPDTPQQQFCQRLKSRKEVGELGKAVGDSGKLWMLSIGA